MPVVHVEVQKRKKTKGYAVRPHDRSLCTQKQPDTAALKANMNSDPMGGQPRSTLHKVAYYGNICVYIYVYTIRHPLTGGCASMTITHVTVQDKMCLYIC